VAQPPLHALANHGEPFVTRTVLIDADLLIHRCAAAVQKTFTFGSAKAVSADIVQAKDKFAANLLAIRSACDAGQVVMALSCPFGENWRKLVLPTYKLHRTKTTKPVLFRELRAWVEDQWLAKSFRGLEGDDVLGIMATDPKGKYGEVVVVSADKDMRTVPCRLFNPQKPGRGIVTVTRAEADHAHMTQTLTGDATDGYTGIPGVGPKKAAAILNHVHPRETVCKSAAELLWQRVVNGYADHGLTEQDALVQARVAHILRHGEFRKNMEGENAGVALWTPERLAA